MADVEELKQLVQLMAQENAKMVQENAKLIVALAANNPGPQQPNQPPHQDAAALRRDKLAKLSIALRKSGKIKDFKDTQDNEVKEWLKRFDQEVFQLKI